MNHFVVKIVFLQIGASICHGFGARNLKCERAIMITVPRHSNDLLLRNALTRTQLRS
jgi:hypothetical protein